MSGNHMCKGPEQAEWLEYEDQRERGVRDDARQSGK